MVKVNVIVDNKDIAMSVIFFDYAVKYTDGLIKLVNKSYYLIDGTYRIQERFLCEHEIEAMYKLMNNL